MKDRLTIVDPTLLDGSDLSEVARLASRDGGVAVCVMNPIQRDALERLGVPAELWHPRSWHLSERSRFTSSISRILNGLRDSSGAWVGVPGLRRTYPINLVVLTQQLRGIRAFLGISRMLQDHLERLKNADLTVLFRRPVFGQAVEACSTRFGAGVTELSPIQTDTNNSDVRGATDISGAVTRLLADAARVFRSKLEPGRVMLSTLKHRQLEDALANLRDISNVAVSIKTFQSAIERLVAGSLNVDDGLVDDAQRRLRTLPFELANEFGTWDIAWAVESYYEYVADAVRENLHECQALLMAMDIVRPDAVLSVNWQNLRNHTEREWCRNNERPFLVMQHGFTHGTSKSVLTGRIDADVYLCWGDEYEQVWIDQAENAAVDVRSVGNPFLEDSIRTTAGRADSSSIEEKATIKVVVAPTSFPEYLNDAYLEFWSEVFEACRADETDARQWVFRTHSLCPFKNYIQEQAEELGATFSKTSNETLIDACSDADLLITTVSSAVVDGFALGIPVLIADPCDSPEMFSEYGAGERLHDFDEFQSTIQRLMQSDDERAELVERQDAFVEKFLTPNASSNLAEAIKSVLGPRSGESADRAK